MPRRMCRRDFVGMLVTAAGAAIAVRYAPTVFASEEQFPGRWPASAPATFMIASATEPGTRLVVRGRVVREDGRPVPGVLIYAYHTDANGLYRPDRRMPDGKDLEPRLQGFVGTDAEGRYEFDTIRPAPYPHGTNPAHIHVKLRAQSGAKQEETIWFEGDPLLTEEMKSRDAGQGSFSSICSLKREGAAVACVRDFRLKVE